MDAWGRGARRVLVVGDRPDHEADRAGVPVAGEQFRVLDHELRRVGVDLQRDCWVANALSCHAGGTGPEPKTPVLDCRPKVMAAVRELDPEVIILLGDLAVKSVIGQLWQEKTGLATRWAGWQVPAHKPNAWLCPTYAPDTLLETDCDPVIKLEFRDHLERAFDLRGRPWPAGPPDYLSRVEVVLEPERAAARLRRYTGGTIAFDYETTCSKPDGPKSEIVCCAVCWEGRETIAFPWTGPVKDALRAVLANPAVYKIASNLDMEDRWTRAHLGVEVVGWRWCTMLAAHALDPRGDSDRKSNDGITGLKFQAFARRGQPAYNDHIEPFLVPDKRGGYELNRVREVKLPLLLKYCGMDALLEWEVAADQMREMGV